MGGRDSHPRGRVRNGQSAELAWMLGERERPRRLRRRWKFQRWGRPRSLAPAVIARREEAAIRRAGVTEFGAPQITG